MICVQVGQCGIQVGQSLFQLLDAEAGKDGAGAALYPLSLFQQLIVDTERKTWQRRIKSESGTFESAYCDMGTSGCGNNWSHGFVDSAHLDSLMNSYRKLAESAYRYDGCMLVHSLAGGTGSGLGSRLSQEIRDQYPKNYILSCSFTPFSSGETAVQNYNALLTLASLQSSADLVGLFSNDQIIGNIARHLGLDMAATQPVGDKAMLGESQSWESLYGVFSRNLAAAATPGKPRRSKDMYAQRAYLHWYERFVRDKTDAMFDEAFETVHSVVDSYEGLSTWQ
eukprot:jgi/Hompol1/2382/HPOL_001440-RA